MDKITIKTVMKVEKNSDTDYKITFTIGNFPNRFAAGVFAAHLLMAKDELLDENEQPEITTSNRTLH
tara:strand:- start:1076 stop:1276 length:201 start_codon:yes stop_codon:yes gene_type:complete